MQESKHDWIGGGNIAGAIGISSFEELTPVQVYLEMRGEAPPITKEKARFFRNRKRAEGYIFETLTDEYGIEIVQTNQRYDDAEFPWARAELDAEIVIDTIHFGADRVEAKSADPRFADKWGREQDDTSVPLDILAQVQWGFGVKPGQCALVVAQVGWDDTRLLPVYRDDEAIFALRRAAKAFMDIHVVPGIPPPPRTAHDCLSLFPKSMRDPILATDEVYEHVVKMKRLSDSIKQMEQEKASHGVAIRSFMGACDELIRQSVGKIATYRTNKSSLSIDWEEVAHQYETRLREYMLDPETYFKLVREKWTVEKLGARPLRITLK